MVIEYYDVMTYVHKVLDRAFGQVNACKITEPNDLMLGSCGTIPLGSTRLFSGFWEGQTPIILCHEFSFQRVLDYVQGRLGDPSWLHETVDALLPVAVEHVAGDRALAERHLAWVLLWAPAMLCSNDKVFRDYFSTFAPKDRCASVAHVVVGSWPVNILPLSITLDGAAQLVHIDPRLRSGFELLSQRVLSGRVEGRRELLSPLVANVAIRRSCGLGTRDLIDIPFLVMRRILGVLCKYNIPIYYYVAPHWHTHRSPALYIPYDFIRVVPSSGIVWLIPRYGLHTQWPSIVFVFLDTVVHDVIVGVLPPSQTVYLGVVPTPDATRSFAERYSEWCRLMHDVQPVWWLSA